MTYADRKQYIAGVSLYSAIFAMLIAAMPATGMASNPHDAQTIVARILEAYGGRAALERVQVVKHSGTIHSNRLGKTGRMERLFRLPDQLRVDIHYPDGPHEQRITTSAGAWRDGRSATAPMHKAMTLQAARFRLPLSLAEQPVRVAGEDHGMLKLEVALTSDMTQEVFVDQNSWHIVRTVGHMSMGDMPLAFTADYADFRRVDGVLFAHREELTAMGMQTGLVVLERIEVNAKACAEDFKP